MARVQTAELRVQLADVMQVAAPWKDVIAFAGGASAAHKVYGEHRKIEMLHLPDAEYLDGSSISGLVHAMLGDWLVRPRGSSRLFVLTDGEYHETYESLADKREREKREEANG